MDNRGILTADLIFTTLLIIIIIVSIITVITDRMDAVSKTEELGKARMIAENVAEAINKVYSGGNGHSLTINLTNSIKDKNYDINVNSSGVYIRIDGMVGKAYIAPKKFSSSNSLRETQIVMHNNMNYNISDINDSSGYNWIVITES